MLDTGQIELGREALTLFRQGLAAAAASSYEQAIEFYNRALELQANCYEVWYERGLALERRGDYIEAIASFDRALTLCKRDDVIGEIWHDRGNALQYGLGEYRQAILCYDRAIKLHTDYDVVWQNRGNALLYGLSLPEEALAAYDRALTINPDNELAWRNRGNALVELRRYDEAIVSYDHALRIRPDDQVSWHARSIAAEKTGIRDRQPTTNPVWYGSGFNDDQTFVEGDTDSNIVFASKSTVANEIVLPTQGQPMLVLEDDWGRREVLLERDRYLIGRDPKTDICLHSQFVSRQHATLVRRTTIDGQFAYQIIDGSPDGKPSTNGLLINGQKCKAFELRSEDTIVFAPRVRATYRLIPASTLHY